MIIGKEYGSQYEGEYGIRQITWKEGREIMRRNMRKDPTDYIESLVAATVTLPDGSPLAVQKQAELPNGLMRRLQDATLAVNELNREEANFLQN